MAWIKRPFFGAEAMGVMRQNHTSPERGRKRDPWVKPRPDRLPKSTSKGRLSGVLMFQKNGKVTKVTGKYPYKGV